MNLQQGKWISVTGMKFQEFCVANEQALQVLAETYATHDMPADEVLQTFLSLELHNTSWEKLNHADHNSLTKWLSNRMRGGARARTFDSYVAEHQLQILRDAQLVSRKVSCGKVQADHIAYTFYVRMKSGILEGKDTWEKAQKSARTLRWWIWGRLCFICQDFLKKPRGRKDSDLLPEDVDIPDHKDPFARVKFLECANQLSDLQLQILTYKYLHEMFLREIAEMLKLPYEKVCSEHKEAIRILKKYFSED